MSKSILPYIVPLLLAVLILRRSGKARTVKPGRMWVVPLILVAMALSALIDEPFPGLPGFGSLYRRDFGRCRSWLSEGASPTPHDRPEDRQDIESGDHLRHVSGAGPVCRPFRPEIGVSGPGQSWARRCPAEMGGQRSSSLYRCHDGYPDGPCMVSNPTPPGSPRGRNPERRSKHHRGDHSGARTGQNPGLNACSAARFSFMVPRPLGEASVLVANPLRFPRI